VAASVLASVPWLASVLAVLASMLAILASVLVVLALVSVLAVLTLASLASLPLDWLALRLVSAWADQEPAP
jgi:hypothetical protein